jgi:hypothetical protein
MVMPPRRKVGGAFVLHDSHAVSYNCREDKTRILGIGNKAIV